MILNSPTISGSLTVTGNIIASGSITLSGSVASASYAATASFVALAQSASYVLTAQTASFVANAQTASFVALAQSASNAVSAATASFANTFTVASTLTAQTLVVQTITSSVDFVTGSTRFGSIAANTMQITGSVSISGSSTAFAVNNSAFFISSSGNIGIGTTISNAGSSVSGTTVVTIAPQSSVSERWGILELAGNRTLGENQVGEIKFTNINTTNNVVASISGNNTTTGVTGGSLSFSTKTDAGSLTERMRITPSGSVGIGTSAPTSTSSFNKFLEINGGSVNSALCLSGLNTAGQGTIGYDSGNLYIEALGNPTGTNNNILFSTTSTNSSSTRIERMRITSGGKVGIGVTNPNYSLTVAGSIQAGYILLGDTGNGVNNTIEMTTGTNSTTYSAGHIQYYSNGYLTICYGGGNVYIGAASGAYKLTLNGQPGANGYTAWTNYSDSRLKENITDLEASNILDKICAIRPVTFNYNELSGFDETTRSRRISGFIAQELMEKFPDMIGTIKLDNTEYYDTNLSNLNLYLVKAIQEQNSLITSLQSRIEALENK